MGHPVIFWILTILSEFLIFATAYKLTFILKIRSSQILPFTINNSKNLLKFPKNIEFYTWVATKVDSCMRVWCFFTYLELLKDSYKPRARSNWPSFWFGGSLFLSYLLSNRIGFSKFSWAFYVFFLSKILSNLSILILVII